MFDDREGIAGVEGVLADAAAKLDDVPARLLVCEANGCQFNEIAEHGEDVAGGDSVAARLWRGVFFHLLSIRNGTRCADFLIPDGVEWQRLQGKARRLVESRCRCQR